MKKERNDDKFKIDKGFVRKVKFRGEIPKTLVEREIERERERE